MFRLISAGLLLFSTIIIPVMFSVPAVGQPRYASPEAVNATSQWMGRVRGQKETPASIMQRSPRQVQQNTSTRRPVMSRERSMQNYQPPARITTRPKDYSHFPIDSRFLPQDVNFTGSQAPGTIVVDTKNKFLYLVLSQGIAKRYGVGVGKEGHGWTGTQTVSNKREWPDWRPPAQMIEREKREGRILPVHMEGGPMNPLGARALYLGSTLYRIHGTNAPWTIGQEVSSGCIRLRNEDVIDLYNRVKIGTKVIVI